VQSFFLSSGQFIMANSLSKAQSPSSLDSAQQSPEKPKRKARAGRPKGSNKEDTLAKILPAARRLFAEKGYAQTTFKLVGKAVGVSHAALYSYFDSKLDLYLASLEHTQALLLPHFLAGFEQGDTLKSRLTLVFQAIAKEHDKDATITGFLAAVPIEMRRHEELDKVLNGADDPIFDVLEQLFQGAIDQGEIKAGVSAANLVTALLGGGVGVALFSYGFASDNLSEPMSVFIDLIEGNLFTP